MICISIIALSISVFGFKQLTVAVKCSHHSRMTVNIYCRKPQAHVFSQPLTANKNSCQPQAAIQNLDPAANRKPYT